MLRLLLLLHLVLYLVLLPLQGGRGRPGADDHPGILHGDILHDHILDEHRPYKGGQRGGEQDENELTQGGWVQGCMAETKLIHQTSKDAWLPPPPH